MFRAMFEQPCTASHSEKSILAHSHTNADTPVPGEINTAGDAVYTSEAFLLAAAGAWTIVSRLFQFANLGFDPLGIGIPLCFVIGIGYACDGC